MFYLLIKIWFILTLKGIKIGTKFENYYSEWQFPKVDFLHTVLEIAKLCNDDGKNLILSPLGKKFLNEPLEKQFSQIFATWFIKVDWRNFDRHGWLEPMLETLQSQSWQILKTLKEIGLQRKFNRDEILTNLFNISERKEQLGKGFISLFLDRVILDYFVWANIIAQDEESKRKDEFGLPFYDKFYLTNFGFSLISSIEEKMQDAIPGILKRVIGNNLYT